MPKVERIKTVKAKLRSMADDYDFEVVTGYTANYALFVHEMVEIPHKVGQAKFLEQPARELSNDGTLRNIIRKAVRSGQSLPTGATLAALRIQRESQQLVPVDTGNLKGSAFTRREK